MTDLVAYLVVDWPVYLIAFTTVVVAAVAQASIGIGFGVVSAPILAILDPALVPGPLLILGVLTSLIVGIRHRQHFHLGKLGYALSGRVLASILGGLTASVLSPQLFLLVFASLMLAAVAISLSGLHFAPTPRSLFVAGAASGYMGTITSVGAPPMAIVYQHSPGGEIRANMSAFLVSGGTVSIIALAAFGAFGWSDIVLSLKLLPALLIGTWLSRPVARFFDTGWMRPGMLGLCVAASILLLWRALSGEFGGAL
ncbi:MAG: sulfite exporter TauE/SafE family protein [Pseudomonadota bacterium]